jgi:hypothetical protein
MNNEFNQEFFIYFMMSLALLFMLMCLWTVYDLDRDDNKKHKHKTKKDWSEAWQSLTMEQQ